MLIVCITVDSFTSRHQHHPREIFSTDRNQLKSFTLADVVIDEKLYTTSPKRRLKMKNGDEDWNQNRRSFLKISVSSSIAFLPKKPVIAAEKQPRVKGAAEYDLEYYLRDAFQGNKREGNLPASNPPPPIPPRTLKGPLLPLLLNKDCTEECIPVKELISLLPESKNTVSPKVVEFRSKVLDKFVSTLCPFQTEQITDQYYFDITTYALYRVVADSYIPTDYVLRNTWIRNTGRSILQQCRQTGLLQPTKKNNKKEHLLTSNIEGIMEVLDLFNTTEFYSSYRLGEQPLKDVAPRIGKDVFDEYDDDDINSGTTVNCLISMFQPTTLQSSLQITGEGSRFSPDFVGATLAAYWEDLGLTVEYETYFVDAEYRPNPKDYFPNEQLLQFSLTKKK